MIVKSKRLCPVLVIVLAGLVMSITAMARHPERLNSAYLFRDEGMNLLVADELLAGKLLYRDLFYQYGPLPAYMYTGFAALFGNSPTSYLAFHQIGCLTALALLAYLMSRLVSTWTTAFVLIAGVFPMFLTPGGVLGTYTWSAYIPLERLCLVALTLTWVPPRTRSSQRALALGAILGIWQGVKFGGAFFAGLALVLVDVLSLVLDRPAAWRSWLLRTATTGVAFLAIEGCWAVLAFSMLSRPVAVDTLWPQFMLAQYESLQSSSLPVWAGSRYFVGQQLTPLVSVCLSVFALATCVINVRSSTGNPERLCLFIPLLFFLLGFTGYFRHVHLPLLYVWSGCLASALLVDRVPKLYWLVLVVCWLPGLGLAIKANLLTGPNPAYQAVAMPNGQSLYLNHGEKLQLDALMAELGRLKDASPEGRNCVIFYPLGAGMHHFFNMPHCGRHAWYLAGFIRPHDEAQWIGAVDHAYAFVLLSPVPMAATVGDPAEVLNSVFARPVFSPELCAALRDRLSEPVQVDSECLVYRVRSATLDTGR